MDVVAERTSDPAFASEIHSHAFFLLFFFSFLESPPSWFMHMPRALLILDKVAPQQPVQCRLRSILIHRFVL